MKTLLTLLVTMSFSLFVEAGYNACPRGWVRNNSFTHDLLLKMRGLHKVGACKLELRVCDPRLPESDDAQVADALITFAEEEFYVPMYVKTESELTASNLTSGQREIIFKFLDENEDPLAGFLEKDRLSLRLNYERTKMVEISLLRRNDHIYNQFIFWKLPRRLNCLNAN